MSEDTNGNGDGKEKVSNAEQSEQADNLTQFPDDKARKLKLTRMLKNKMLKSTRRQSGVVVSDVESNPVSLKVNSPERLLKAILAGQIDPNLLTRNQRLPVVQFMLRDGATPEEVADVFGVSVPMIYKDKKKILRDIARHVAEYNPQLFVAWYFDQAEHHIALAKKTMNYALSWSVVTTLARQLTEWGLVIPKEQIQRELEVRGQRLVDEPIQQISNEDFAALEAMSKKYAESA